MEFLKSLPTNPWIFIFLASMTILMCIFGFASYFKNKRIKQPKCVLGSKNIIKDFSSKINKLEITYDRNKIQTLTVTKLAFWNQGKDTINYSDVPKSDLIRVQVKGNYKILDVKVLYQKRESNMIETQLLEDNYFLIKFEYLDYLEGCVIQILHTGYTSYDIEVFGTIKGFGVLKKEKITYGSSFISTAIKMLPPKLLRRVSSFFLFSFCLVTIFIGLILGLFYYEKTGSYFLIIVFGLMNFILLLSSMTFILPNRTRIPKEYDLFDEEF